MSDNQFYTELVCRSGHVITDCLERSAYDSPFCTKCGEATTSECEECNARILGELIDSPLITGYVPQPPAYCHNCGNQYPWTRKQIEAAKELAKLDDNLTSGDIEIIESSMEDIMCEGPKTKVGAMKLKKILGKAGKVIGESLREIFVDIASETAKRVLLGQ